jgi:alpha-D-xyloside xylohydrolase
MSRRVRTMLLLAGVATALLVSATRENTVSHAAGPTTVSTGVTLRVDRNPFRLAVLAAGKTVVRESPEPTRLRYQLHSSGNVYSLTKVLSARRNVYTVATNEPGGHRTATVVIARVRSGFRISVRIKPATDVQQVYDAFDVGPDEHFLGGGERTQSVDLSGQILPIYTSNQCSYAPVPFFASSGGWALRLEGENVAGLAFPGSPGGTGCGFESRPSCEFPAVVGRVDVCMRGSEIVEDVFVGSPAQTLADYQAQTGPALPPPDSELALIKWRGRTEFSSQADLFDDIQRFRAARIPIGWVLLDDVWQTCMGTLRFDRARFPDPAALIRRVHGMGVKFMLWVSPKSVCGTYPQSQLLGARDNSVLDLRKPAVVAAFRKQLRQLVALGIDGVKGDRGDEVDLEPIAESLQNRYPLLYAKAVMPVLPRGSAAIFRAATVGSQRLLPGIWAGDQSGDYSGLQAAIRSGETAAMSGFPTWGSDVGGYNSPGLTAEVFARWTELGAVSPVLEVGGAGPNSTPWTLGPTAMAALRDSAVLHYELFPYLDGLLRHGLPVLRPLGYAYPGDAESWKHDLEFLVGPDMLAAPVTRAGTKASIYLPPGAWIDLHTGARVSGGRTLVRRTPLIVLPLYLRVGAVVPFNLRTAHSWWGVDELEHRGRAGFVAASGTTLAIHGQPRDVQIFVPAAKRPRSVTLGGRRVVWSWSAGPLPGVVIRLRGPSVRGAVILAG